MREIPNRAKFFIVTVMLIASVVTVYAVGTRISSQYGEFLLLLALAVIAARLKLTLPGFESSMSMNLPFMLLAISELPLAQAIAVGAVSTFAQTLSRSGQTIKPIQALFNVCNMVNAIAIASVASGRALNLQAQNKPFLISAAALAFFLADTIPVAAVISMTSPTQMMEVWSEIALMTFPYFVLSAGVASIVAMGFQSIGWMADLGTMAVMLGVYRCFRFYFQSVRMSGTVKAEAKAPVSLQRAASAGAD